MPKTTPAAARAKVAKICGKLPETAREEMGFSSD